MCQIYIKMFSLSLQENMMTASNLAICVGPSILWSNDNQVMVETNYSKNVSNVAQVRSPKLRCEIIDWAPFDDFWLLSFSA